MRAKYKRVLISSLAVFFCAVRPLGAPAETINLAPQGEYAKIDVRLANESIKILSQGSKDEKNKMASEIIASPQKYAPPVFYALSSVLFQRGEKDMAGFWFYAGQLRARFDANRCADISAREAVAVLNDQYGCPINQYMFKDVPTLEALIPKVVEWDRLTPHDYDNRWINLHGMGAIEAGLEGVDAKEKQPAMSLPKDEWELIAEKTRQDYLAGFKQAMLELKKRS